MYSLLLLNLIIPFVMILVGDILKRHPATDIKSGNGYNTPTARKSQEHWNYAQSIAPNNFISLGKVLGVVEIILSIGMFLLQISVNIALTVGICTGIVFVKRKCEQKGPQKVSTFSTRFHVVSNAFPKYQMLTF